MSREIRTYSGDEALVRERRMHIKRCALKTFLEKGYNGTTMRELAKACGMAQGALYYYIGSKSDILHLLVQYASQPDKDLEATVICLGDITVTEALKACVKRYFQMIDTDQDLDIFFNREIGNFSKSDRAMLLQSQVGIQLFFEKLLVKGMEAGEFHMDSPKLVAHNILMLGFDWAMRRWYLRQYFNLDEYTQKQIDLLLKAILPKRDASAVGQSRGQVMGER